MINTPTSAAMKAPKALHLDRLWSKYYSYSWLPEYWTLIPLLILMAAALLATLLTDGHPGGNSYWMIQQDWFFYINHAMSSWSKPLWANLTVFGDTAVLFLFLSPLIIWRTQTWGAMLCAIPLGCLFSVVGKNLASIPRPAAVLNSQDFTVIGDLLTAHNSLPSGHSITIFAGVVAILVTLIPKPASWKQWVWLVVGLLIATILSLSRVAVGAHWPLDVSIGACFGWLAGLSGAILARQKQSWWCWAQCSRRCNALGILILLSSLLHLQYLLRVNIAGEFILWCSSLSGIITSLWLLGSPSVKNQYEV